MSRWGRAQRARVRKNKRDERLIAAAAVLALVLLVVAALVRSSVADVFDGIIGAMGDSPRDAALVGWAAGFSLPVYGLVVTSFGDPLKAIRRTWPIPFLLIVPNIALMPGRTQSNRTEAVKDEFFFLGSFFDTYFLAIFALLSVIGAMVLVVGLQHLDDIQSPRCARIRGWRAVVALRRVSTRAVTAAWVVGVFVYAMVVF